MTARQEEAHNGATATTTNKSNNATNNENKPPKSMPTTKFEKDWVLNSIKRHQDNHNSPADLRSKILAVAPMVDQSDLPFRLLCRKYGANLAFTPMIHARLFCELKSYRERFFNLVDGTPSADRPLIAQLCGSDIDFVCHTAKLLEPFVDGIDLNCGCPQGIAKRGNYGAFLLEQPDILLPLVTTLANQLSIPVSVKVRILPTTNRVDDSLKLYQSLVTAGASMLTIHGRTRLQKGPRTGRADWNIIRQAVELFPQIPILANGSMSNLDQVRQCLDYTKAAGVMCSEALLEYPPMFMESSILMTDEENDDNANTNACVRRRCRRTGPGRLQLAQEYLELAKEYPPHKGGQGTEVKCPKAHVHRFLHADLQQHTQLRTQVVCAQHTYELEEAVKALEEIHTEQQHNVADEQLSWYVRHQTVSAAAAAKPSSRTMDDEQTQSAELSLPGDSTNDPSLAEEEDAVNCRTCLFGEQDDGDY